MALAVIHALVLITTLYWTHPAACTDGAPLRSLQRVNLYARRQSPTWVLHSAAMLAHRDTFDYYWPTVRREADALRVESNPLAPSSAGRRDTLAAPFVWPGIVFWHVTHENAAGESQPGNVVGR